MRCVLLSALFLMALTPGCRPAAGPVAAVSSTPTKLPVIALGDVYPRGETAEQFWGGKTAYFQDYEQRLKAGQVETREKEALRQLFEIETVRRAAEARIREYNRYARETNARNNYQ